MNNNVFFDLNKKYNSIPNNSHVRCCQFILVGTLSLVFFPYGPPCLLTLSSQFCCLAMQKKCLPHWFLRDILACYFAPICPLWFFCLDSSSAFIMGFHKFHVFIIADVPSSHTFQVCCFELAVYYSTIWLHGFCQENQCYL